MKPMDLVRCVVIPAALMALSGSCTKTAPSGPVRNPERVGEQPAVGATESGRPTVGSQSGTIIGQTAAVPVALPRSAISRDINLANLTFTVKYAGVVRTGPVKADGNKISMTIGDLPTGKKDDFVLSLDESNSPRYSGSAPAVELKAGDNVIDITLKPVAEIPPPNSDPNKASFARDLKPIFEKNCGECHHPGKPLDLTSYPQAVDMPALVDRIFARVSGAAVSMPPQPRDALDQVSIEKIKKWKTDGFQQ